MSITITSLRADYRVTSAGNMRGEDVPYTIINVTFRIEGDPHYKESAKSEAEDFRKSLTIDDPERYENFLLNWDFNFNRSYDGFGRAWVLQDPLWQYIEKFDTFWFREWIADSPVTRAIISELEYFAQHNKLKSVYRHADECIILSHLRTLSRYWD